MIAIIGLGFVGLTTALGLSVRGHNVYGFDKNREKMFALRDGHIPFHEPSLQEILKSERGKGFFLCDSLQSAIEASRIIIFCVGTPSMDDETCDLSILLGAISESLQYIKAQDEKLLVIKSTVPPGSASETIIPFIEKAGFEVGGRLRIANNPEFLREGFAWQDFMEPDRIVIGACNSAVAEDLACIYRPFGAPIIKVSLNTAEFIKYLSNTLLSTMVSFANDMSMIAHYIGNIDIPQAFLTLHMDKRWSGNPAKMNSYVYPGCGFGGYCLPKDTKALAAKAAERGYESRILREVMAINARIKAFVVDQVTLQVKPDERLAVLGLSFKPASDDIRETPAADIIDLLLQKGYKNIMAYDPLAVNNFRNRYNFPIAYAGSFEEAVLSSDSIIIVTAWEEFLNKRDLFARKKVFDYRYFLPDSRRNL
jgi:UDPglucose 6-dehydrogenase